jgi:small subunit ribosomal protein S8e
MPIIQHRSYKKPTGARYVAARGKRKFETGRLPTHTRLGARKVKKLNLKGGGRKTVMLSTDIVNLLDPKTKKHSKAKIKNVLKNPANRHYVRRNILTKGTVIETEKGKARITNRPGQEGTVNAVLVAE